MPASVIRGVVGISGPYVVEGALFGRLLGGRRAQQDASPLLHVDGDEPPFLLLWAERDMAGLGRVGEQMAQGLEEAGVQVRSQQVERRTALTILLRTQDEEDPVRRAIGAFVAECCRQ